MNHGLSGGLDQFRSHAASPSGRRNNDMNQFCLVLPQGPEASPFVPISEPVKADTCQLSIHKTAKSPRLFSQVASLLLHEFIRHGKLYFINLPNEKLISLVASVRFRACSPPIYEIGRVLSEQLACNPFAEISEDEHCLSLSQQFLNFGFQTMSLQGFAQPF